MWAQPCCISTGLRAAPRVPVPHPSGLGTMSAPEFHTILQSKMRRIFVLPSFLLMWSGQGPAHHITHHHHTAPLHSQHPPPPQPLSPVLAVTEGHSLGPSEGRGSRWFLRGRGRAPATLASYSWLGAPVHEALVLWLMLRGYLLTKQDLGRRYSELQERWVWPSELLGNPLDSSPSP